MEGKASGTAAGPGVAARAAVRRAIHMRAPACSKRGGSLSSLLVVVVVVVVVVLVLVLVMLLLLLLLLAILLLLHLQLLLSTTTSTCSSTADCHRSHDPLLPLRLELLLSDVACAEWCRS